MGKKGAKRKTRWRTLSIGTPPGEEDEKEGSRSSYEHQQQSEQRNQYQEYRQHQQEHNRHVNGYGSGRLKQRHGSAGSTSNGSTSNGQSTAGSTTSSYASGGSGFRGPGVGGDDFSDSPTFVNGLSNGHADAAEHHKRRSSSSRQQQQQQQQKVAFNENEYIRIVTPRQDILFKKSYLTQKKPWSSNGTASMSVTPSTAESHSASHSTADGSEAAEDQQLPVLEAPAQLSYGSYYDPTSGYYYEYPMMLMGPAVPESLASGVLASMPCGPVPLRPIEWVNPAYVPKLASQQYCYMDYQATPGADCASLVDTLPEPTANDLGVEVASLPSSASDSISNASSRLVDLEELNMSGGGGTSSGIVDIESNELVVAEQLLAEPQLLDEQQQQQEELVEMQEGCLEYIAPEPGYVETLPPAHLSHVIQQPLEQPSYIYPGQYMFGPPVINVNGVTIQSEPMLRYSDMLPSTVDMACVKRKKRKKKRKQPKRITGNMDEDEEFSSECENSSFPYAQTTWSLGETVVTVATIPTPSFSSRPLNPECQEFHLRPAEPSVYNNDANNSECQSSNFVSTFSTLPAEVNESCAEDHSEFLGAFDYANNDLKRLTAPVNQVAAPNSDAGPILANGDSQRLSESPETLLPHPATNSSSSSNNSSSSSSSSSSSTTAGPKRAKYNAKTLRHGRELTPGPDLTESELENDVKDLEIEKSVEDVVATIGSVTIAEAQTLAQKDTDLVKERSITPESCCNESSETNAAMTTATTATVATTRPVAVTDEDSGFECQSRPRCSSRPITDAVNEWLKRVNSPDLFITSSATSDTETEEEKENGDNQRGEKEKRVNAGVNNKPSKNLQGNPMPALSVNGDAKKREPNRGKFARPKQQRPGVGYDKATKKLSVNYVSSLKGRAKYFKGAKDYRCTKDLGLFIKQRKNKHAVAQDRRHISVTMISSRKKSKTLLKRKIDGICEFTDKDSDVGMRVAENSRIDASFVKLDAQDDDYKFKQTRHELLVKTFEKGEIVVSMDGELLLVDKIKKKTTKEVEGNRKRFSSAEIESDRYSLGSIEEPDVLEYWETETVEPVKLVASENVIGQEELPFEDFPASNNNVILSDRMEYVQLYYRLQAGSNVTSTEDESSESSIISNDEILSVAKLIVVPTSCSVKSNMKEMPVFVTEIKAKSIGDDGSQVSIDEAFEAYESCYTGKSDPFASINRNFEKSRFFNQDREAIPCKAVCCNIQ